MGLYDMPRGYDAWRTAAPPDPDLCCPKCGKWWEDIGELDVDGLGGRGLMSYPLRVPDPTAPKGTRHLSGHPNAAREHATFVTILKCDCGWVGVDDALIECSEWAEANRPGD